MKKIRVKGNSNPQNWLPKLALGFSLFGFGIQTGVGQFNYIPDVIRIVVKESSPPSLALAEVNADYIDNSIASNIPATPLKVGLALLPQLELEEILIGELEQADSQLANRNSVIISSNEKQIYGNEDEVYPENLSQEQLSRLKIAQQKYQVLDQVWSEPQFNEESMGEKVRRLNQNLKDEEARNGNKSQVIVRGDDSANDSKSKGSIRLAENSAVDDGSVQSVIINETKTNKSEVAVNTEPKRSDKKDQHTITVEGLIEFARKTDLVLTPDHRIEVRRFAEGVPQEFGIVRLPEATFNIEFQSTYGTIIAQLINANGVVEGQGVVAVQDLIKNKNFRPTLVIRPSPKGNIQVASAYGASFEKDFQKSIGFDIFGASDYSQALPKESYFDNSYADSEAVVQATAKNHVTTTAIISLADGADLMLLPDKMINGLSDILSEQGISLNLQAGDSLIWGQVRKNGKPIEGATVFAERTDPIYFGGMHLPDQLRTTTSDNGMFVVVVNEPGWKDLFIQREDGSKLHLNVLTFPGKVAQVFAELPSREIPVSVRSFDAFSGEPARAKVQIQQIEDMIDTGEVGLSVINIPATQSLSFIHVFPEAPYMDAKFSYTKLLDYIHIPMIRREWLDQVARQMRINPDPNKGIVVSFVQNGNYDFIASSPEQSNERLVYFDSKGEVTNSGLAGGGFILYNQPTGFVGITLEDKKHQRKFHKISFPENKVVSILNFIL
jgi:hypothetical protein